MKKWLIVFGVLFLFLVGSVNAATYYIRAGATGSGNGADWTNAWTDINYINGIGSGDVIYIAAGTYTGNYVANSDGWTLRRATAAEHGTGTGWSSSYDGTVTINNNGANDAFVLSGHHGIIIDGVDKSKFIISSNDGIWISCK